MFNNECEDGLIATLNNLLTSLDIPITVTHAFDLVPSLILAIFESLLRTRLPISPETRKSATYPARVEAMKIFIGVLGDDILGVDVGLARLDPRRLAEGREEELMYVGEILCWMGKKMGYLTKEGLVPLHRVPADLQEELREEDLILNANETNKRSARSLSPSTHSTLSASHASSLLVDSTRGPDESIGSQTTVSSIHESRNVDEPADLLDGLSFFTEQQPSLSLDHSLSFSLSDLEEFPRSSEHRRRRQWSSTYSPFNENANEADEDCNYAFEHRIERGNNDSSSSMCHCPQHDRSSYSGVKPPVRMTGHLMKVDFTHELEEYEKLRKSKLSSRYAYHEEQRSLTREPADISNKYHAISTSRSNTPTDPRRIITRHTSPSQHALALLNERARLLSEIAGLKMARS